MRTVKTILIGQSGGISVSASRWIFIINGLLMLTNGVFSIFSDNPSSFGFILGILLLLAGVLSVFCGIVGFSPNSKFSAKVRIDDETIELKKSIWTHAKILKWKDISSIAFSSYELHFLLLDSTYRFAFDTNPEISREIKHTVRNFAERKNIEVTGG